MRFAAKLPRAKTNTTVGEWLEGKMRVTAQLKILILYISDIFIIIQSRVARKKLITGLWKKAGAF